MPDRLAAFMTHEIEILGWSLDDHAAKVLARAKAFNLDDRGPNLAYLDTMILKNEIDAELEKRRRPTPAGRG